MGGAGAWHIGVHYADQFCAIHAGAVNGPSRAPGRG
jgi:hypothetical protein